MVPVRKNVMTQRREAFCVEYFASGNGTRAAIAAGYSPATAYSIAHELLKKPEIQARLAGLQQAAADAKIMSVVERKQRLTELSRENIYSRHGVLIRQSNIAALTELNRMEQIGTPRQPLTESNTQINIIVPDAETKDLLDKLMSGERLLGGRGDEDGTLAEHVV